MLRGTTRLLRRFARSRPQLAAIAGVAEVASVGGDTKELLIETTADQLRGTGLAFSDGVSAVKGALKAPNATLAQVAATPLAAKRVGVAAQPRGTHPNVPRRRCRHPPAWAPGQPQPRHNQAIKRQSESEKRATGAFISITARSHRLPRRIATPSLSSCKISQTKSRRLAASALHKP